VLAVLVLAAGGFGLWKAYLAGSGARIPTGFQVEDRTWGKEGWAKVVREPRTGMEFVLIEPGRFRMGSKSGADDESHVRKVTFARPFYLAKTEVTQAQWQKVMDDNPSLFKGPKLPVEQVSWNRCREFIGKLNQRKPSGWRFSLPSEAQWEYACRAGWQAAYSFGDDASDLGRYAWYANNSNNKTHDVATKLPNRWGLYDMHGNVWEWCADTWHWSYAGAPSDGSAWVDSGASGRVFRGGGWFITAWFCRSADRSRFDASDALSNLGIRPAMVVTTG